MRLTVSLDTLDEPTFRKLSGGRGEVSEVLAGIAAAEESGFGQIKLNCVVMRGVNDGQILDLIERFRGTGHIVRFIEYMDVGTLNQWQGELVVPSAELIERIAGALAVAAARAQLPRRSRGTLRVRRRRRRDRLHQFGLATVLRRLFARAPVGRRQDVHVPVRA
jgi:Molybdenum cofactor biosynthesis enzyme